MRVDDPQVLHDAATRLQVWAFPLVLAQRVRLNFTQPAAPTAPRPLTSAGAPLNHLGHQRALSDPGLRVGVAPNVDTLYSVAWLDLDQGEPLLVTPHFRERYYSFQIALADTRSPWSLGQRTHGPQLPPVRLARGPLRLEETDEGLRCTTPHRFLMVCGRILVEPEDPRDLTAVHRLQDLTRLQTGPRPRPSVDPQDLGPRVDDLALAEAARDAELVDPSRFVAATTRTIADCAGETVPAQVVDDLRTLAASLDDGPGDAASAIRGGLEDGLAVVRRRVATMGGTTNGWALNERGPEFDDDHLLRAAVAMSQVFINPAEEATYAVCQVDRDGAPLDGRHHAYTVTFTHDGLPPAAAFWSLTMYHREGLLVENRLHRYAIGDRTPGLVLDDDGSLVVHLATDPPSDGGNWLPAPAGPFRLMLRTYHPDAHGWQPPAVVRLSSDRS